MTLVPPENTAKTLHITEQKGVKTPSDPDESLFPIRELSARTHVNTVTLRAWERRYGLLKPLRTNKGHRLYAEADVSRVEEVLKWMARGVPVGKVKALLSADPDETTLTAGDKVSETSRAEPPRAESADVASDGRLPAADAWVVQMKKFLFAARSYRFGRVERLMKDSFLNYPASLCREKLIEPAMQELQNDTDNLAAYHFEQSDLIRYTMLHIPADTQAFQRESLLLIGGDNTPIWRLALVALELTAASFPVKLINQACSVESWVQLAQTQVADKTIVYQDGLWRDHEISRIEPIMMSTSKILLCGTAPMVSPLASNDNVFSSPQALLITLLASK